MLLQVRLTHGVATHRLGISSYVEKRQREKTASQRMNNDGNASR
jgi:hypothetical protein